MRYFLRDIRYRLEFVTALVPYTLLRLLPRSGVKYLAWLVHCLLQLIVPVRRLVIQNVAAALPELDEKERRRIAVRSLFHMVWNLLEFFWIHGDPERIRKCYSLPEDAVKKLQEHTARNERIIFVNPHLGSWEASGTVAPFYADVRMAAIAKPVKNPYLNDLLNAGNRAKTGGLEVIFSRGAVRASLNALRSGKSLGTLIDQNTRIREGGEFVNFFGLPVPSSTAPAAMKRYCDTHDIPAVIIFGVSLRGQDGRCTAHIEYLSKPFSEYADDRAVIQELMKKTEHFIRLYPEQYLWLYKRFQYIPPETPEEIRKRFPAYAETTKPSFYSNTFRKGFRKE